MRRRDLPGGIPPPTKTELKRQAGAVQDLADRLVAAPAELVDGLGLPEKLADAIVLARRIPGGGALVRQRQFVAKLLRGIELGPIRAAPDAHADAARVAAARSRRAERWRDRLLEGGAAALEHFVAEFAVDREEWTQLVGDALGERHRHRQAGAGRRLFRRIRDLLDLPAARR